MIKKPHYRELKKVTFVWHGAWSDPELIYKKHSFNYWDIEETLASKCNDEGLDASDDTVFDKWIKNNKSECYAVFNEQIENK